MEILSCSVSLRSALAEIKNTYQERRDLLVAGLKEAGFEIDAPKATFYLWVNTLPGFTSTKLTSHLLTEAAVVTTPGVGFGASGEGYIRITLTVDKERIAKVVRRIKNLSFK